MAVPIIKIENARGEVLNLSADPRYVPILTGTGPPKATINRSKVALKHGTKYNSSTKDERNLLLTVYFKGDIARARLNLYNFINTGEYIKVYYTADSLDVWTEGYIETAEVDPWTLNENMQASIICPESDWRDIGESYTNASAVEALFEFPFAVTIDGVELSSTDTSRSTVVYNNGNAETSVKIELVATLRSLQPRIYNLTTGQYMGFYVDMLPGDRLVVTTETGKKSVTHIRDGVETNYIDTIMEGSDFLTLAVGANEFSYTVDEGEMELHIYHTNLYSGV